MTGRFTDHDRRLLRRVAEQAIAHGLTEGRPPDGVDLAALPASITQPGASFVTLELGGRLRGCIGSLAAREPLARDVAANAWRAAFADPRFPPLQTHEMLELAVKISVLSAPEPVEVASEAELLEVIRPGVDGLILEDGPRRGTFLPAVWEQLPDPRDFLAHLKRKAGLPADHWSPTLTVQRYTAEAV